MSDEELLQDKLFRLGYETGIEFERERCVQAIESLDRQNEKYPALIFRHEAIEAIKANTPEGE